MLVTSSHVTQGFLVCGSASADARLYVNGRIRDQTLRTLDEEARALPPAVAPPQATPAPPGRHPKLACLQSRLAGL